MEDWKAYYRSHLVSMEEAVSKINSGDNIWLGQTTGVPYAFLDKLFQRKDELEDVGVFYNFSTGMYDMLFDPESKGHFRIISIFTGPLDRMSGHMGIEEFSSNAYESLYKEVMDVYKANTMVIEVCPPDENGNCNVTILGAANNALVNADPRIKKRIAVVNKGQFAAQGDYSTTTVPVTDFDYIVEDNHDLSFLPVSPPTEVDKTIASYIMPFIHDGDTVQIGMGGLGEQITQELRCKKNIQIYTEITVDSMVDLVDCGAVTHVATCGAYGSPKVYEFVGTNPKVETRTMDYMLDPMEIGKQDNLVAINCTLMVDLLGQACSEAQGIKQYSSVGGSFAYLYGAMRSKGGRSFLCLRSTYKNEAGQRHSNIVPWLPEKSIVTTPKYLHMYIVSEYGVADVYLRTNKDRIRALLKIAHPDYQAELKEQIISTGMISEEEFAE